MDENSATGAVTAPAAERCQFWRKVLKDFSKLSTIHGVRQVGQSERNSVRRRIWLVAMLVCWALFSRQLVVSVMRYFSYPVSTDISVWHTHNLPFPAVTICNQNSFRVSVVEQRDAYPVIRAMMSQSPQASADLSVPLNHLYQNFSHTLNDTIFRCTWNQKGCKPEDFTQKLTDSGVCFTFNSGQHSVKTINEPGAEKGLRLVLNIEQYEYLMSASNNAAGLTVLIHNQSDISPVSSRRQAIAPGTHTFQAVSLQKVFNLEPPHGKCGREKKLRFFRTYTQKTCEIDCVAGTIADKCSCRMHYMPNSLEGSLPVCSVLQYIACVKQIQAEVAACDCPEDCERLDFHISTSYASTTDRNMKSMLKKLDASHFKNKLIQARESVYKIDQKLIEEDEDIVMTLKRFVDDVENQLEISLSETQDSVDDLEKYYAELGRRIYFHMEGGLDEVRYIVRHDFVRGYTILEERTLPFLTFGYADVPETLKQVLSKMAKTNSSDGKRMLWATVGGGLYSRLKQGLRAIDNLTEVNSSYTTGKPLLTYKATIDRRYDMTFISTELLRHGEDFQKSYFDLLMENLNGFVASVQAMLTLGENAAMNTTLNGTELDQAINLFLSSSAGYNNAIFQYKEEIVVVPEKLIDERIKVFLKLNDTLHKQVEEVKLLASIKNQGILDFMNTDLSNIKSKVNMSMNYVKEHGMSRFILAKAFTSAEMNKNINMFTELVHILKSRARDLTDAWTRVYNACADIWVAMATESTTHNFYEAISKDVHDMINNPSKRSKYVRIFANLLGVSQREHFFTLPEEFLVLVNGDFHGLDIADKLSELKKTFNGFDTGMKRVDVLSQLEEELVKLLELWQNMLLHFVKKCNIDTEFYKENFIELDVFMKELNILETKNQVSYDGTHLWSDIGGSLGLFIGASILTLLEILDIIFLGMSSRNESNSKTQQEKEEETKH